MKGQTGHGWIAFLLPRAHVGCGEGISAPTGGSVSTPLPKDSPSLKHIIVVVVVIIIKTLVRVPWLPINRPSYILSLNSDVTLQRWLVKLETSSL